MARRKRPQSSGDWLFPRVSAPPEPAQSSLLDLIDNALNKGVVVKGDIVLGVADVDLIYAKLSVLLSAFDRVMKRDAPHKTKKAIRKRTPRTKTRRK